MAKSKNGGTRAYIRGRIGSDVYSVGKNSRGQKQQVVRSLAETVSNPRTSSQMFGRMVMSTVMQAVHAFKPIIDHSFDGFPKGQPSISEFIRLNYALIKDDAIAHPTTGNTFGLNKYQEKGVKKGKWVLSQGSVVVPSALSVNSADGMIDIALTASTMTVGGLKAALNLGENDYITMVGISATKGFIFARLRLNSALVDETAITDDNVSTLFQVEGNTTVGFVQQNNTVSVNFVSQTENMGVIITDYVDGVYHHSSCVLSTPTDPTYTYDVALPTYPTGTEMFLNGGDI